MLEKNSDSEADAKIWQKPPASIAFGLERMGLIAVRAPILSCIILVAMMIGAAVRHRAHQGRQFAQPAVPLRHAGVPAIRGGDQALPVERVRRAGRGRGQDAAERATISRSCATSSPTCSSSTARAASSRCSRRASRRQPGKLPAPLFPAELPRGRRLRPADRDASRRTRSSAASCCRRTASWRWSCSSLDPEVVGSNGLERDRRRDPQDDGRRTSPAPGSTGSSPACR